VANITALYKSVGKIPPNALRIAKLVEMITTLQHWRTTNEPSDYTSYVQHQLAKDTCTFGEFMDMTGPGGDVFWIQ
jgi:hypothetical protein